MKTASNNFLPSSTVFHLENEGLKMYLLICITKAAKQINVKLRRGVMAQMESQKAQDLKVPGSSPNQGKTN